MNFDQSRKHQGIKSLRKKISDRNFYFGRFITVLRNYSREQ